jgi:large subunit ribosomal protein L25
MQILNLPVEMRDRTGSANSRRYRRAGQIPCILYGRGQENLMLVTPTEAFESIQKAHTALVRLTFGEKVQTAMIRDVRWDTFGEHVEHIDFFRVEPEDDVLITVPVTYTGVPVGAHAGGSVQILAPELELHCRVDSIPSELKVDITHLEVEDSIHVGEIEYPPHVRPARPDSDLLIHVKEPRKVELPEDMVPEEALPEGEAPEGEEKPEDGKAPPETESE